MPLERFIPKSPDPFIRNSQDFEVAKFGHLNTIIEYVNNYVVTDGLQLSGTGPLSTSLRNVTDNLGNVSPLKLSTLGVQIVSPLRISTDDPSDMYLDCEDGSENNRFNITRNTGSQQVNLNFASNPTGSTSIVGAIRTYANGSTLSEVLQFREDGTIFGSGSQTASNFVIQSDDDLTNLYLYSSACWGGLLTNTPLGNYNTILNGRIIGTHGGTGNSALALGTIQADTSGSNFSIAMGAGCTITNTQNGLAIGRNASIISAGESTAIGYQATTSTVNAIALGNLNALLQIGGNFTPTARVHIKGLGSTSATTSLLVQNSAGSEAVRVRDNLNVDFGGNILATGYIGDGSNVKFKNIAGTEAGRFYCDGTNLRAYTSNGSNHGYTLFSSGSMTFGTSVSEVSSAIMAVTSTSKGFLPPVMTTTQKNAIVTPTNGLIVYDSTTNKLCCYNGSTWNDLF
jgi:hypothetical protein